MNIFVTVIALTIFTVGIFLSQRNLLDKESNLLPRNKEVLSEDSYPEENITSSTQAPAVELPSPTKNQAGANILGYRYPGAQIVQSSENSLILESSDSPEAITNWYKAKIESENLNVESFVETSANDKVLNELVGADGQKEIKVGIKKESGTQLVEISVCAISALSGKC